MYEDKVTRYVFTEEAYVSQRSQNYLNSQLSGILDS